MINKNIMNLLIKFPTRQRKDIFFNTLNEYYNKLDDINTVKFVITCDIDDESMNNDETRKLLDNYTNLKYYFGNSKTKIEAVNNDMDDLNFDILLLASDDMIPQIKGYDTIIKNNMLKHYPDNDGVLWFFDGFNKYLNTISIMGIKYYKRFNYIYHPLYKSFYCDNDFMIVAQKLNKQIFIDKCIIKHMHPDNTNELHKEYDNTYHKNNFDDDRITFEKRMSYISIFKI